MMRDSHLVGLVILNPMNVFFHSNTIVAGKQIGNKGRARIVRAQATHRVPQAPGSHKDRRILNLTAGEKGGRIDGITQYLYRRKY